MNRAQIERLIGVVQAKIDGLPPLSVNDHDFYQKSRAFHAAADAALDALALEEQARVRRRWDGASLQMAGVRCTSTSGSLGVMHNWINAAKRKLEVVS